MWTGAVLSAVAHGAVVALALWGLPWLRARPEPPVPVVAVSLIDADAFAALAARRPAPPAPAPTPAPETAPAPPAPTAALPEPTPESEAPPEVEVLSPFDTAAPLGIRSLGEAPAATVEPRVVAPRARPRVAVRAPAAVAPEERGDGGDALATAAAAADYGAAVRAAIAAAQVYPDLARVRGLAGTARLEVSVTREGRLVNARVVRTSGFQTLDRAALDATVRARLPAAPAELPGQRFSFEVAVVFRLDDG